MRQISLKIVKNKFAEKSKLIIEGEGIEVTIHSLFYFGGFMPKKESLFQHNLIKEIEDRFPNCMVLKNDPTYVQGIPDLLILWNKHWAMLEVKRSEAECLKCIRTNDPPNQQYYVNLLDSMSYASYIYPENKEEVLDEMEQTFKPRRGSRLSKS